MLFKSNTNIHSIYSFKRYSSKAEIIFKVMRTKLFYLFLFTLTLSSIATRAQKQTLYIEPKITNSQGINPFNYDNKIYVADKLYVYEYFIILKGDTLKYSITRQSDGATSWKYVPKNQNDSSTVAYLGIKTLGKAGPIMMDKPDYNQTELFLYHYNNKLKPLDTELTGVIENSMNVWLHPFRFHALEILQLAPFPYARSPYRVGQTYYWDLNIGKQWPEFKAINWKGNLSLRCAYVVKGTETLTTSFGTVKTVKIESVANTEIGRSKLTAYFNEQLGFIKLIYYNLDGSSVVMALTQIK